MTRRHTLEHHRHSLAEIREIMNSMKTLAFMETRKLSHFLAAQQAVVSNIEDVAADLLGFHPEILPQEPEKSEENIAVYLLIGTERGFCGDFNHALLRHLESTLGEHPSGNPKLVAVGRKLTALLEGDDRIAALIEGAGVAEEVPPLITEIVNELANLQNKYGVVTVYCLYHGSEADILTQKLLPPFQGLPHGPSQLSQPPLLNQSPQDFLLQLTEHYLFAALYEMFYTSLMLENQQRVSHLDGAVRHLDDEAAELARRSNALRQEEIIEEIEVILLSAASLGEKPEERDFIRRTSKTKQDR